MSRRPLRATLFSRPSKTNLNWLRKSWTTRSSGFCTTATRLYSNAFHPPPSPVLVCPQPLMTTRMRQALRLTVLLLAGCANSSSRAPTPLPAWSAGPPREAPWPARRPRPTREFRGLWVASVQNLDWPSRPGLDAGRQKAELTRHPRPRRRTAYERHHPAGPPRLRRALRFQDRAVVGVSQRQNGRQAPQALLRSPGFRRRANATSAAWNSTPGSIRSASAPAPTKRPAAKNYVANTRPELVRAAGDVLMLDPADPRSRGYSAWE
jgi:hypothetical protein